MTEKFPQAVQANEKTGYLDTYAQIEQYGANSKNYPELKILKD